MNTWKTNRPTIEEDLNGPTPEWVVPVEGQKPIIPGGGKEDANIVGNLKAKFLLEMETLNYELDNSTDQVRFDITKKDGSKLETVSYRGQAGFRPQGGSIPRGWYWRVNWKGRPEWLRLFIGFDPEKFRHLNTLKLDHFNAKGWVSLDNEKTEQFIICGMLDGEIVIDKKDIEAKPHIEGTIDADLRLWRVLHSRARAKRQKIVQPLGQGRFRDGCPIRPSQRFKRNFGQARLLHPIATPGCRR